MKKKIKLEIVFTMSDLQEAVTDDTIEYESDIDWKPEPDAVFILNTSIIPKHGLLDYAREHLWDIRDLDRENFLQHAQIKVVKNTVKVSYEEKVND